MVGSKQLSISLNLIIANHKQPSDRQTAPIPQMK